MATPIISADQILLGIKWQLLEQHIVCPTFKSEIEWLVLGHMHHTFGPWDCAV